MEYRLLDRDAVEFRRAKFETLQDACAWAVTQGRERGFRGWTLVDTADQPVAHDDPDDGAFTTHA